MRIVHLGLLSLAFVGSSHFAEAATVGIAMKQSDKTVVSTHDLDLSTDAGFRTAQARIRRAAERVCGGYPRVGLLPPTEIARCRTTAAREADAKIATLASSARDDRVASTDAPVRPHARASSR
ncbi:UrcA family protein [Sphingomonas sp. 7/4-4]|jgi:UrcA family protein|uniref:UrcA family protein n=1 Tax=Sphingomonas sp. 7/4-4 TaxID=3018446 RepID=UPI0022F3BEC2|nr:UrcA family protein [Sphingomonas sp. 7/4-4]WBY06388.1 UrcA family protein [Sphingomonas sp. 7/4-4]